jgi:hypothetical protein
MTPQREKAFCPLTDRELDPADWCLKLLYAAICELHTSACIDYRVVKRDATFLPPYPHKAWELELVQRTPFQQSPVMSALEVAFDLMRARKQQRVAQGKAEPGAFQAAWDELTRFWDEKLSHFSIIMSFHITLLLSQLVFIYARLRINLRE